MVVLLGCLAAHIVIAGLLPSPWWVPDLTLVGLIVAIGRSSDRWAVCSGLTGLTTAIWAIRFPQLILAGSLFLGWIVHALAKQWDITDLRLQWLLVAVLSCVTTFGWLWLEDLWSLRLIGIGFVHVLMTSLSVPLIRRLAC